MGSEDEGEEDEVASDDGEVEAFPEIDARSDTDEDDGDYQAGDENDEEDDLDPEDEESEDASDDDLRIFPQSKTIISDITGQPKRVYPEIEPDYDSDSSTEDAPNRVGSIPMHWYDDLPHIGYDINGKKVLRPARGDELDNFLKTVEDSEAWTSAFDKKMQMDKPLTPEELDLIRRLQEGENPDAAYDPYEPTVEWFTGKGKEEVMPISAAPEPKRRWIPSKWEKKKVMKIVRAIRAGRIVPNKPKTASTEPRFYSVWNDEPSGAPAPLPAPKPQEYLPSPEERAQWEATEPEDRERDFLPQKYSALRLVPAYDRFIKERFGRQLDLYLAPRVQRVKLRIDPESLIPKLPSPSSLKPFPRVRALSVSPDGGWAVSGDESGVVKLWEVMVGKEVKRWTTDVSFFARGHIHFIILPISRPSADRNAKRSGTCKPSASRAVASPVKWTPTLTLNLPTSPEPPKQLVWHRKGIMSLQSEGQAGVWIHQMSRRHSQAPFKKVKGAVQLVLFHPSKPHFFVATQRYVRMYDLAEQKLLKTLTPGTRWISSMDVHPSGDHLIVGGYDRKLCWFDLELSDKPYKILRYHARALRSVAFHPTYPLFASSSDDGSIQIFHARVYNDLMTNPLIVPLKILRGHGPWLVSAGADGQVAVWCS
ncbi:ribosome biogenesis protein ERB1 [Epithele typhae]|uniref:ribosome biogenesis protein ERB1 n=1 Tax=Epithele typhae TaxID=378194 RepID=UPI002008DCE8|nr:ribosome biogenesis protein ERB1 [Epithele typhae]KAH9943090.1 ribosome biogenesis protein ERB1 [Epithele typhae]